MDIGERLRQLRLAKDLSQGEIERKTGLLRSYLSRVECGHTQPSFSTLEKWAKALDLEVYQIFFTGRGKPKAPKAKDSPSSSQPEKTLLEFFERLSPERRRLLLSLARELQPH